MFSVKCLKENITHLCPVKKTTYATQPATKDTKSDVEKSKKKKVNFQNQEIKKEVKSVGSGEKGDGRGDD